MERQFVQAGMMSSQEHRPGASPRLRVLCGKEMDVCITIGFTACDQTLGNSELCVLPQEKEWKHHRGW